MPVRRTLALDQIELSYLDWDTAGQPVLLLHGLADHALVWSAVGDWLAAQGYRPVAPDMRGHGQSSKPDRGYDFDSIMQDLENLLDHLDWATAHVVGHSWSGKVAAYWATRQPQRFLSMTLVDPIFVYGVPGLFRVTFPLFYRLLPFLKGMGPFPSWEAAQAQGQQMKQYRAWTPLQQTVFKESLTTAADGRVVSRFIPAARDGIFDAVLRVPGLIQPVPVPSLFIQPAAGVNRYDWQLSPYRKYLTHLLVETVPGNHWAFLGEPEAFSRCLLSFLDAWA